MTNAYRSSLRPCPACARAMEERSIDSALIDVCPACKGLWIDWLDGDLQQVAHDAAPLSSTGKPAPDPSHASCPECRSALALQRYGGVVALYRCGECAGTFVPRGSFEALTELTLAEEEHPSALRRLANAIARLFDAVVP